jgi:hypothetical protein
MSSKTRTRKTATSTIGSAPALRSVPDQNTAATVRTDAEDKLWEALHTHPNTTAVALAVAAKIGKSTAQKILAKWAGDGSVTRTPGIAEGGRRAADLWAITDADPAQIDLAPGEAPEVNDGLADVAEAEQDTPATCDTDETVVADSSSAEPVDTEPTVFATEGTPDTVDVTSPVADAEPASTDGAATDHDQVTTRGTADTTGGRRPRLASGALRGMVEDFLRDHPGEEFGPTTIANALGGKSSGAVSNALDKLVEDGTAVKTNNKPRRFTLAQAEQKCAAVPTN